MPEEDTSLSSHGRVLKLPKIRGLAHFDAVSLLCNLVDPVDNGKAASVVSVPDEQHGPENDLVAHAASFTADIGGQRCESAGSDLRDHHSRWYGSGPNEDALLHSKAKDRKGVVPSSCTGVLLESPIQHQLMEHSDTEREEACNIVVTRQQHLNSSEAEAPLYRAEHVDLGAYYYRQFFFDNEHQNFFGLDDNLGPVAISLKRDFIVSDVSGMGSPISLAGGRGAFGSEPLSSLSSPILNNCTMLAGEEICPLYRIIVRTSRLSPLRVAVLEDCIGERQRTSSTNLSSISTVGSSALSAREVISYALPTVQMSCLRLARADQKVYESLMRLDEQNICRQIKAGIMYCAGGQSTEEEMYNNINGSPLFNRFLECLGSLVPLKGFSKYRAQLDNKNNTTGTHSVYTEFHGCELMFHVSTLLPHTEGKKQQLLRKRHIGNDILTIVFQESDAQPFSPTVIRSQFQHVFIIVRHAPKMETPTSGPVFQVAVTQSRSIPDTPPMCPAYPFFTLGPELREFVLAKLINMENAAHRSAKFRAMAMRTRREWLVDLVESYTTSTLLDPQNSAHPWGRLTHAFKGKRGKSHSIAMRPVAASESRLLGGVAWSVLVTCWDRGVQVRPEECTLCISSRFLCVLNEKLQQLFLFIPVSCVLGWTMNIDTGRMCIYYGIGECLQFNLITDEEHPVLQPDVQDVASRLSQFSEGSLCQEIVLHRSPSNHLGFMLLGGGIVGEVDPYGVAWKHGVRQNSRVLEINGTPLCGRLMKDVIQQLREKSVTLLLVPSFATGAPSAQSFSPKTSFRGTVVGQNSPAPSSVISPTPGGEASPVRSSPVDQLVSSGPLTPPIKTLAQDKIVTPSNGSRPRSSSSTLRHGFARSETIDTPTPSEPSNGSTSPTKPNSSTRVRHQVAERCNTQPTPTPYSVSDVQSPMFKGIVAKAKASLAASVAGKPPPARADGRWFEGDLSDSSESPLGRARSSSVALPRPTHRIAPPVSHRSSLAESSNRASSPRPEKMAHGPGVPRTSSYALSDESVDQSDSEYHPEPSIFAVPENASPEQLRQVLVRTQSELLRCQHKLASLRKENSGLVKVVEKLRSEKGVRGQLHFDVS